MVAYIIEYAYTDMGTVTSKCVVHVKDGTDMGEVERIFRIEERKWQGSIPLPSPVIHTIAEFPIFP